MTEPPVNNEPHAVDASTDSPVNGGADSTIPLRVKDADPSFDAPRPPTASADPEGTPNPTSGAPRTGGAGTGSPPPPDAPSAPPSGAGGGGGPWGFGDAPFAARYGLIRPVNGRYFAGVCAAIGRATNTDPILWRIMLGVLTVFGGIGLVAYLVGWLLIPSEGDTASPLESLLGRGRSGTSPTLAAIVAAAAVLTLLFALSDGFRTALLGLGVIIGAALLLSRREHSRQPHERPAAPPPVGVPPPAGTPGAGWPSTSPSPEWSRAGSTVKMPSPSAGYPAGAPPIGPLAPRGPYASPPQYGPSFGNQYSYPLPPPPTGLPPRPPAPPSPPRPKRPRSPLGRITISVLFLALGVLAIIDLTQYDVKPSAYLATSIGTIGLGLLVGAWFGRARWLISIGLVLSVILAGVSAGERWDPPDRTGNQVWTPSTVDEIESEYDNSFGEGVLDLRNVDFSGRSVELTVDSEFGKFEVILPQNVDVDVKANFEFGNGSVLGNRWNGRGDSHQVHDTGPDGAGGGSLSITADVDFGDLEVHR